MTFQCFRVYLNLDYSADYFPIVATYYNFCPNPVVFKTLLRVQNQTDNIIAICFIFFQRQLYKLPSPICPCPTASVPVEITRLRDHKNLGEREKSETKDGIRKTKDAR